MLIGIRTVFNNRLDKTEYDRFAGAPPWRVGKREVLLVYNKVMNILICQVIVIFTLSPNAAAFGLKFQDQFIHGICVTPLRQ